MPIDDGISLLAFGLEKEDDDKLFARWVGFAQYEVSFDDFKRKLKPVRVDEEKTLERIDELMAKTTWSRMAVE